ncbi:MAG: Methyltransferase type 11 [Candidatus Uhrbacteria bacterium GW2011_GWF2_39_13]|uniref:Methyltransferase type 11 n=1 Tax=Candidatus Uhrbacteria bacterium GW2011_GWF2_39_13 TaxID=1618995 RepID=A0A0G0MU98_9BACT|nr:MAG: Methyltransferase type 11 [Candidatus Uhrbacteria bacterium GW2011_GWF2_39_13]
MLSTDKAWEKWGQTDPYYGILANDNFRKEKLNAENKRAFFESGEEHIKFIMDIIDKHIDTGFVPSSCLDFGCGVGRLVIPLAKRYKYVVGIDVSDAMLTGARQNCLNNKVKNVDFYKSDDNLSAVSGKFDLIHSSLVFQHIPVNRGERILKRLLELLNDKGVAVLQFVFYRDASFLKKFSCWLQKGIPFFANVVNIFRGRKFLQPPVQMNSYDITEITKLLKDNGVENFFAIPTVDGEYYNITLFCRKTN